MTSICKKEEKIKINICHPFGDNIPILAMISNMIRNKKENKLMLVKDEETAHYNIILNAVIDPSKINLSKSILLEVSKNINEKFIESIKNSLLRHYSFNQMLNLGTYMSSFCFDNLENLKIEKIQNKKFNSLSCCISKNYIHRGETQLHDFLIFLQNKSFELDIFGESLFPLKIKEQIDRSDLGKGLIPYKYTIVYEPKCEPDLISEKIFDAILSECFVFYHGCLNIENWVNSDCFLRLDLFNFENDLKLIKKTISEKTWEKRIETIKNEKIRIIKKFNLLHSIEKIINDL